MTKDTTDLDEQILLALAKPYLHERAEAVKQLISNREKLARLERGIYELERLHHIPQMFGDWENVIDERIATLRKELDGGQSDE